MKIVANQITDDKIIPRIVAGETELFTTLYNRYKKQLMLTCLRYISDRGLAEDVLQESFVAIYKDLKKFDKNKGKFITWATRVTVNKCLKKLRKKSVFSSMTSLLEIKYKLGGGPKAVESMNLEDLTKTINSLPKGYRMVFNMYVIDGFTHKEIAEKLKISESTSKTQLMRSKKLLRQRITEDDYNMIESYA